MKRVVLPSPPDAADSTFRGNQAAFNQAITAYLQRIRGLIEDASRINDTPVGQQFQVSSFTTNTAMTGTASGTDVANFVCSLCAALTQKGLLSPTTSRTSS